MSGDYDIVIGLETHVQLKTSSKLFSGCPSGSGGEANQKTDPVILGMPGVLPTLNEGVLESAVRVGLALGCQIQMRSTFARKHYFYPDLPKGYQITQDEFPICLNGLVQLKEQAERTIRVKRIHLEEDAGKTVHDAGRSESRVDYNRAGTPLIEIVTEPDFHSPEEAVEYLKKLHQIVTFLDVSDGDMEAGNFRFDANISLKPAGSENLGTKTELKNMNSFRFVQRALEAEVVRQRDILDAGGHVIQETRMWNEGTGRTESMRSKESAPDYRYMPEPDLPEVLLKTDWLEKVESSQPELPDAMRERFASVYGLSEYDAEVFTASRHIAGYFESVARETTASSKRVASWVGSELLGLLSKERITLEQSPVSAEHMVELLDLIEAGTVSGKMGKDVLEKVLRGEGTPKEISERMGTQVSDPEAVRALVKQVLERCPEQVEMYRAGKTKVLGFLMGQVMRESRGKANPEVTTRMLQEELSNE